MARRPSTSKPGANKARARKRTADAGTRLSDAALKLAALQGWADTSMADIADEAGVPLAEMRALYPSKTALLGGFIRRIDADVLTGTDADIADEPVRDRLFDLIMRRFEALAPYKAGLKAVLRDLPKDPASLICIVTGPHRRSLEWMLEAARIDPWGPLQPLQVKGLGLVYAQAMRTWLRDDSDEQSKVMATLDRSLGRAESMARFLRSGTRREKAQDAETSD